MSIVFGGQKRKYVIKRHQCAELLRNFAAYCVISRHNLLDHAHQRKRLSPLAHGSFPRLLSQNNRLARETSLVHGEVHFVLLSLLGRLGCTERSVRLARTTITSTPRSVNGVEVHSIFNLLVDQGGLLPVKAMECQLFV